MKKQFLFLAASALILASCGENKPAESGGLTPAQADSIANAKIAQHDAEMAAKNDSTLKAVEAEKAAAEAKAREAGHAHAGGGSKKHTEKPAPAPAPAPAPPPPTVGNGKPSMSGNGQQTNTGSKPQQVGNGKPSMK